MLATRTTAISIPSNTQHVWIDVGTASRSDFEADAAMQTNLFVLGIEPTPIAFDAMHSVKERQLQLTFSSV